MMWRVANGVRAAALVTSGCLVCAACGGTDAAVRTPSSFVLLTGPDSGAYFPLGKALAEVYNAKIPDVQIVAAATEGPAGAASNPLTLLSGRADLAFSRSDLAYQAFRGGSTDSGPSGDSLRSIAVVYTNAVHVLVRRSSGITKGADFRHHRVVIGDDTVGSPLARTVLEGYGVGLDDVEIVPNSRNAVARMKAGEIDVRIFASAYPLAGIDDVGPASEIRLLSIEPDVIDRLRSRFSFFKPAVIPKDTYPGQSEDVQTVGIDGLLLCRDSMPEALVYQLTKSLFDALPALTEAHRIARLIDVGRAPATPVPLHPGAARYYRERDLFR